MRLAAGLLAVLVALFALPVAAYADDDDEVAPVELPANPADGGTEESGEEAPAEGFTATGDIGTRGDVTTITRKAGVLVSTNPSANPVVAAAINSGSEPDAAVGSEAALEVTDAAVAPPDDTCLERAPSEYNAEGDFYYTGRCIKRLVCGVERIDDVVSGDIAGEDVTGRYASFLDEMIGYIGGDSLPGTVTLGDVDSVNDFLIAGGLGDSPGDGLIPVFYWCAPRSEDGTFDPIEISSASFGWDLTYDQVYDIPGVRASLYLELTSALDLYDPQVGLVPPAAGGYTFVQWPTWMFLENPLESEHVFTENDTGTFRIDLRATLEYVEWSFGDEVIDRCTAAEMLKYDPVEHDPIEDLPDCNYRFTELATEDLTTTIVYKIEERILDRITDPLADYPAGGWVDYLGTPTLLELSTTLADYEVHPIVAVNVYRPATVADAATDTAGAAIPTGD